MFNAALSVNPNKLKAYFTLGQLYQQAKEYQKAIEAYEIALQHNPRAWFAANNLAVLLSDFSDSKSDIERALALAKKSEKLHPDRAEVIDTLGWIYYKLGDYERSLALIGRSLARAPESSVTNYHMGMVLYQVGRLDEAKEKLRRALNSSESFIGKEEAIRKLEMIS